MTMEKNSNGKAASQPRRQIKRIQVYGFVVFSLKSHDCKAISWMGWEWGEDLSTLLIQYIPWFKFKVYAKICIRLLQMWRNHIIPGWFGLESPRAMARGQFPVSQMLQTQCPNWPWALPGVGMQELRQKQTLQKEWKQHNFYLPWKYFVETTNTWRNREEAQKISSWKIRNIITGSNVEILHVTAAFLFPCYCG